MTYENNPIPTAPISAAAVADYVHEPAAPKATKRFNALAVVAFSLSLLSALGVPAVIIGHFALSDIKKTGERGRVLAILGLVFGYLTIATAIVFSFFFFAALSEAIHRLENDFPGWQDQLNTINQGINS